MRHSTSPASTAGASFASEVACGEPLLKPLHTRTGRRHYHVRMPARTRTDTSSDLQFLFEEMQQTSFLLGLIGMFCLGSLAGLIAPSERSINQRIFLGIGVFGVVLLAWTLSRWRMAAGAAALIIGALLLCWAAIRSVEAPWLICLVVLPLGLLMLIFGARIAVVCAALLTTMITYGPDAFLPVPIELRLLSVLLLWFVLGLIRLALRPIVSAAEWAWSTYERGQHLVTRMTETQFELQKALTDTQQANLQLTRMNVLADGLRQIAEDAHRVKQQFVTNVSHELRTPLNMIIGFSEIIVNQPHTYGAHIPPALLADLDVILRNSRHLSDLIDDVLDLSQIESNQMALTREHVQVADIVTAAVTAIQGLFTSKKLYLRTQIEPNLPLVFCDPTRIREVVLNLLSNAGRFMEAGGADVLVVQRSHEILVSIHDTGPGISAEDAARLFQPFRQVDGSVRRRYGGSGLGLAISKSFVELHDGRIWLDSVPGAGSTFFFTLPIEPPAPLVASATRWLGDDWTLESRIRDNRAVAAPMRPRIVVLDSQGSLQRLLRRYLASTDVVTVTHIEDIHREVAMTPTHAVLVNAFGRSSEDDMDFLQRTDALPNDPPIIICSTPSSSETSVPTGASGYLAKPVSRDALHAIVDRLDASRTEHDQPLSILVVDDEPQALHLFWRMLNSLGRNLRVHTAGDARQALELMQREKPHIVFVDLVMPDTDGFWLLNEIHRSPTLRGVHAFVISASDPSGQPIVSDRFTVTRPGGLSLHHLLSLIDATTTIISPMRQSIYPTSPRNFPH